MSWSRQGPDTCSWVSHGPWDVDLFVASLVDSCHCQKLEEHRSGERQVLVLAFPLTCWVSPVRACPASVSPPVAHNPAWSLLHGDFPNELSSKPPSFPPQAAPEPPASYVPRIILTECAPSPPEGSSEDPGACSAPTPRPRTLDSPRPQALPELVATASWPRSSLVPVKGGAAGKRLARGNCPWAPTPDGTQEPPTMQTATEETLRDWGHGVQTCCGELPAGDPSCTMWRDSLEETLQELEATLRELGAGPPAGPSVLHPRPQVAASVVCPYCSATSGSGSSEWRVSGLQEGQPSRPAPHPVGSQAEPGQAGKPAHPGLSPPHLCGNRMGLLSLCSVPVNQQIKISPPSTPAPLLLSPTLSALVSLFLFLGPQSPSGQAWYLR